MTSPAFPLELKLSLLLMSVPTGSAEVHPADGPRESALPESNNLRKIADPFGSSDGLREDSDLDLSEAGMSCARECLS